MSPCRPLTTDGTTVAGWICSAPTHRLTNWVERIEVQRGKRIVTHTIRHKIPGNRLYRTDCCRKLRPAKNLTVNGGGWYDPMFYCQPGKGCKAQGR